MLPNQMLPAQFGSAEYVLSILETGNKLPLKSDGLLCVTWLNIHKIWRIHPRVFK